MKIPKLALAFVALFLLNACSVDSTSGSESGSATVKFNSVSATSFSVQSVDDTEAADVMEFVVDKNTDFEMTKLSQIDGSIQEIGYQEFYYLWTQTDTFNETSRYNILYQNRTEYKGTSDEVKKSYLTIRMTELY